MNWPQIAIELVKVLPNAFLFLLLLVMVLYRPAREAILSRITTVKGAGFELSFTAAQHHVEKLVRQKKLSSLSSASPVLARAQRLAPLLMGSNILWVDDRPERNREERNVLRAYGVNFILARSTEEAVKLFQRSDVDLVISDMERENAPKGQPKEEEGERLLDELGRVQDAWHREDFKEENDFRYARVKVIFYVSKLLDKPTPPGAYTITTQPEVLYNHVLDILEAQNAVR